MRTSFLANFTRTFDGIVGSIRRHYAVLLQEEAAASKSRQPEFSLALLPLKDLAPLLAAQAREISRMRSTLAHAREEKYKTREVLVRLYDSRHQVLSLIEDELKMYRKICRETLQYDLDACSQEIATWVSRPDRSDTGEAKQAGRSRRRQGCRGPTSAWMHERRPGGQDFDGLTLTRWLPAAGGRRGRRA